MGLEIIHGNQLGSVDNGFLAVVSFIDSITRGRKE
jgi:hypothetical protein